MEIKNYLTPDNLEEVYQILCADKKNQIIAGGAWLKLSLKKADTLISLDNLGLNKIEEKSDFIEIGSMVTLREIETDEKVNKLFDGILSDAVSRIMGMNIRNQATLGGSVMGKFAFSDILPVLLVMDTKLKFYKQGEISLEEFLNKTRIETDILEKVLIKKETGKGFFKKAAITALDFSIVNIAISKNALGFKIAIGSRPQIAKLASETMKYLNDLETVTESEIEEASMMAVNEMVFSNNNRSSKEYRENLARVYVKRGLKKVIFNES